MNLNGKLSVPDIVTIPYIAGDGVGKEISPVMIQVVDAAVLKAYDGTRKIEWLKLLAGQEAFDQTGQWLPEETLQAFTPARYSLLIDLLQTFTEKNFNKKADNLSDYRL